ncbi:hypothetical protein K1719_039350 [Acacia pycnantha]|nr:hypothetical protein K1719_039350 [Acacia pycnantha]
MSSRREESVQQGIWFSGGRKHTSSKIQGLKHVWDTFQAPEKDFTNTRKSTRLFQRIQILVAELFKN